MSARPSDQHAARHAGSPPGETSAASARQLVELVAAWFAAVDVASRPLAVALSGGVDSAVVAKAAALSGREVVAVTARSASVAAVEQTDARQIAESIGMAHVWVEPNEVNDPAYQQNDVRRCYFCKSKLYATISARFPEYLILSGTNFDDLGDYRPGLQAADEARVRAPLAELKIGKAAVRQLARHWQLVVSDKPASPCLASRIAYGVSVTPQRLQRVEQAEQLLRAAGWKEFRVRLHPDEMARIEVPTAELSRLLASAERLQLVDELKRLGFRYVTLDLEGFRSGSLNPLYQITDRSPVN